MTDPNPEKVEAFAGRLLDMLNYGALAVGISIGHRTRLFDTMAGMEPATAAEIAERAGLVERYVREWLGAMVLGRVVLHDAERGTFRLPPEHAACLTRAAAPNNLAAFAQYIPVFGTVEDGIVRCFVEGGGLPYAAFPRFHEVMAEDSGQSVLPALLEHILPLVPGLTDRLEDGIDVLDLGCGRGLALMLMARAFPRSRFTGYDFSEEAIGWARREAEAKGLTNLRFEVRDATELGETGLYDLICTFDAIHDQAHPDRVLGGICQALRDDGVYLMQDIGASSHLHENVDHPMGTLLYTVSYMHCMTVSLAQDGAGLGTMWGRQTAQKMLREAGFEDIQVHQLPHDVQNEYYVIRR